MRYLVVLDVRSTVGRVYAGSNDGGVADGELKHPALDCTEIATDGPCYLFAIRDMTKHGGGSQRLYVPHGAVAFIICYADEGPMPLEFVPPSSK
jgi:hypothetical protein